MMMADLEECTGTESATASCSDVPLIVQVLHDAQVMLHQAFAYERQGNWNTMWLRWLQRAVNMKDLYRQRH